MEAPPHPRSRFGFAADGFGLRRLASLQRAAPASLVGAMVLQVIEANGRRHRPTKSEAVDR